MATLPDSPGRHEHEARLHDREAARAREHGLARYAGYHEREARRHRQLAKMLHEQRRRPL